MGGLERRLIDSRGAIVNSMSESEEPNAEPQPVRSFGGRLLAAVCVYIFLVILLLPFAISLLPMSIGRWVAYLVLAPPFYLAGEWLSEKLSGNWGERSVVTKALKAIGYVLVGFVFVILSAFVTFIFLR